ncbi:hypothetical protein BGZ60DRAFT_210621 [Tricladium varicosporioides]|nr:hypothetical protein BGZ60DRAFT_210621 [Hymenoscyphus varicosporioides]
MAVLSSENTTYLITGANRGIGLGLTTQFLLLPETTIVAAVRNPMHHTSQSLLELPHHPTSSLIIVTIDSITPSTAVSAIKTLQEDHGITKLDLVIANAGISENWPRVEDVDLGSMEKHYAVNVIGVAGLFKVVLPLLNASPKAKFVTLGSSAGVIGEMEKRDYPNAAYGPSKAALHYVTKKIHLEHPNIIAFPVDPGWVQTDMGDAGAANFGLEKAEITVEESVKGLVKVIQEATREKTSGKLMMLDGSVCSW